MNKKEELRQLKQWWWLKYFILMDGTAIGLWGAMLLAIAIGNVTTNNYWWSAIEIFWFGIFFTYMSVMLIKAGKGVYIEEIYNFEEENGLQHSVFPSWKAYGVLQDAGVDTKHLSVNER